MPAAKPQQGLLDLEGSANPSPPKRQRRGRDVVITRAARFSACGGYRWWLSRVWGPGPIGLVVMVNPSTASDVADDATIRSLIKRATAWGWGGFVVVNLFALVSTSPETLKTAPDPIGPENDVVIATEAARARRDRAGVVVAWGSSVDFADPAGHEAFCGRDAAVLAQLRAGGPVDCIARTSSGAPKHPLARGKSWVPENYPLELFAEAAHG